MRSQARSFAMRPGSAPDLLRRQSHADLCWHDKTSRPAPGSRPHHPRARPKRPARRPDHPDSQGRSLVDQASASHMANEQRILGGLTEAEERNSPTSCASFASHCRRRRALSCHPWAAAPSHCRRSEWMRRMTDMALDPIDRQRDRSRAERRLRARVAIGKSARSVIKSGPDRQTHRGREHPRRRVWPPRSVQRRLRKPVGQTPRAPEVPHRGGVGGSHRAGRASAHIRGAQARSSRA
jgi:hypothetical protein